jgi:hypothetical protein
MSLSVDLLSRGFSRFAGLALILAALIGLLGVIHQSLIR